MQFESMADWPEDFGDPRAEYRAMRESVALFPLPGWTHIELTGRDRAKFLHNFCTNDIRGLETGQSSEAFVTNVQGKTLAFITVHAALEALWLTAVPGCAERIIGHLSRYQISEEVAFTDRSSDRGTLLVAGPNAGEMIGRQWTEAEALEPQRLVEVKLGETTVQVRRHDFLRTPGLVVVAEPKALAMFGEQWAAAGARRAGRQAFEALRIEAGFPWYGVDLTEANLAQEASRTAQAISFSKGCYLGQEPIARIDAMGHVNQQLRGLRLAGGGPPPPGSEIFTPIAEARKVGQVTSSAVSYADDRPVALAYLRRGFETPGANLDVRVEGRSVPAVVFWPAD